MTEAEFRKLLAEKNIRDVAPDPETARRRSTSPAGISPPPRRSWPRTRCSPSPRSTTHPQRDLGPHARTRVPAHTRGPGAHAKTGVWRANLYAHLYARTVPGVAHAWTSGGRVAGDHLRVVQGEKHRWVHSDYAEEALTRPLESVPGDRVGIESPASPQSCEASADRPAAQSTSSAL